MVSLAPPLPRAAQRCSSIPENSEPHRPPLFCPKGVGEMAADDYKGEQQEGEGSTCWEGGGGGGQGGGEHLLGFSACLQPPGAIGRANVTSGEA